VGAGEKREIIGLLTRADAAQHIDRLANMGPRILPILFEVATLERYDHTDHAWAFQVVRRMNGMPKDAFVAAAAKSLARSDSVRFSMAAVALIADSKDAKYAPAVCGLLCRVAKDGSDMDVQCASRIARALAAVGTCEELKIVEQWRKDNPPLASRNEFEKRDEQEVQNAMREAEKLLRKRLKK